MSELTEGFTKPHGEIAFGARSGFVYDWLKARILSLDMAPGSFIDKAAVADRLGISKQPVTVALGRLAREGWVEVVPQIGSYVARIQIDSLREQIVLWHAIFTFIVAEREEVRLADFLLQYGQRLNEMEQALGRGDWEAFCSLDHQMQRSFARRTALQRPLDYVDRMFDLISHFYAKEVHMLGHSTVGSQIGEHLLAAHRDILSAMERGEPRAAADIVQRLSDLSAQACDIFDAVMQSASAQADSNPPMVAIASGGSNA